MAPKREDLAKRFDTRLKHAPARGAIVATQARATPSRAPARPAPASRTAPSVRRPRPTETATLSAPPKVGRGAAGRRLRGHLVPRELHGDARRRKLRLEAEQQRRITWDEVATQGLELLIARRAQLPSLLEEVRTIGEKTGARRLVQATIPFNLDRMFSEVRLDLSDKQGRDVSYEALWSSALLLWMRSR